MRDWIAILILLTALGCGLIAGVFFAFSSFVMGALARLPAAQGIAAMQSINRVVINPVFLTAFLGPVVTGGLLITAALFTSDVPRAPFVIAGSLCYIVGTFGVTMTCNVPRNDALAAVDAASDAGAAVWARYVPDWTAWNTVRTIAALVATALLTLALR